MSLPAEIWNTLQKLSALEERIKDVRRFQDRIEDKFDSILERIVHLEERYESLRSNVKNEILADLKGDIAKTRLLLDIHASERLSEKGTKSDPKKRIRQDANKRIQATLNSAPDPCLPTEGQPNTIDTSIVVA